MKPNKKAFDCVIGHENAINQICISISGAIKSGKPVPNFLFVAPQGTGKNLLSRCIAGYLGYDLIECNISSITEVGRLCTLINSKLTIDTNLFASVNYDSQHVLRPEDFKYSLLAGVKLNNLILLDKNKQRETVQEITYKDNQRLVVFLDEMQLIRKRLETELLTLLSEGIVTESGRGRSVIKHIYKAGQLVFVGATTNGGALTAATRRRFFDVLLTYPTDVEKALIIASHIKVTSLAKDELEKLAGAANTQAECVRLAGRFEDYYYEYGKADLDGFFEFLDLESNGLNRLQRLCLYILMGSNTPVSIASLSSLLSVSKTDYNQLVESALLKKNLVRIVQSGREITDNGRNIVLSWKQ